MAATPSGPRAAGVASALITTILLVAAAILFIGIFLVFPGSGHAFALLLIGILGVIFAVIAYLLESVSREKEPTYQRATAWAFYAFGFAVVLLTLGLNPTGYLTTLYQVLGLVITLVLLAGSIALISWRYRTVEEVPPEEKQRAQWRATPPTSALDYGTAKLPAAPATAPAPSSPPPQPPASGGQ